MERDLRIGTREINPQLTIFDLAGDMNIYNSSSLQTEFEKQVAKGVKNFVVNLKDLVMIDSAGIGVFFTMLSTVQESQGNAVLLSPNQNIRKLFDLTQISSYFTMTTSEEEAIAKATAKPA